MDNHINAQDNYITGKLPWRERLSYGASDFACSFTFSLIGTYLMYLADCKIKPNTLHKKTAETLMVID